MRNEEANYLTMEETTAVSENKTEDAKVEAALAEFSKCTAEIAEKEVEKLEGKVLDPNAMAKLEREKRLAIAHVLVAKSERDLTVNKKMLNPPKSESLPILEGEVHLANAHLKAVSSQNHAKDCLEEQEQEQEAKAGRLESANDLKMQAKELKKQARRRGA